MLRYPRMILGLAVASVAISLLVTSSRLHFSTDRTQLLDAEHPIQKSWRTFRAQFGGNTDMVVLITGTPEETRAAADLLARQLEAEPDTFDEVFYRLDLPEVGRHALYFLSLSDLQRLGHELRAVRPWLDPARGGLPGLLDYLSELPDEQGRQRLERVLPLLERLLQGLIASLETRGSAPYRSPLPAFRPESRMLRGQSYTPGQTIFYNTVGDEHTLMLIVQPRDRTGSFLADSATVARLRQVVLNVLRSCPRVNCLVSGEPLINTDEMVGARDDAMSSGFAALVLVSLLLTLAFGDSLRPACAVASLLVGLSWSLAFASLTVGSLNLLTVHFATILVGLSMTFAIQILSHYQELRSHAPQEPLELILEQTIGDTGPHSLIGAVTTGVAFWSLRFTNFRAAGELGLITGTGVLLCFISILTLLPTLLGMVEAGRRAGPLRIPGFAALGERLQRRPWWVLGGSLVVTLYSLTWINRVPFNYNVLSLQAKGSDSVRVERYLQGLGYSTLYAVTTAPSTAEAYLLAQRLERLSTVAHVETLGALLPQDEEEKRPLIAEILGLAGDLQPPRPLGPLAAEQLLDLDRRFRRGADRLEELLAALPPTAARRAVESSLDRLRRLLDPNLPGPVAAGLEAYQQQLTQDVEKQAAFLHAQLPDPPNLIPALPAALRARSISASGRVCLRIFPRYDCWEREPLELFVKQLRQVDPQVTGSPLLIYYYLEELRQAYGAAGRNALLVICVLLLLHFRSFSEAALALFPKLLGVVWMIGTMGLAEVSFNAANFLALPITLGIGLIFGVNILLECRAGGVAGLLASATGSAVFLSGLTAAIGFSSFLMASHLGVSSFGFVMAAGVGANLLTSLFTLPALLSVLDRIHHRDTGAP